MGIIKSIVDNDLYKFTQQYAVIKKFPDAKVEYDFINRGETEFPEGFDEKLKKEIENMSKLSLRSKEKTFLRKKCSFLPEMYIDFLSGYKYDPKEVTVFQEGSDLKVKIKGFWYSTILWEVPLMSLISELYFKETGIKSPLSDAEITQRNQEKVTIFNFNNVKTVADFGSRRRFSFANHDRVLKEMTFGNNSPIMGTSNLYLAMKHDLIPIGTQAHEWIMFHAAKFGYKMSNKFALDNWVDVYRGDLGIALSDTFTSEVFFKSFDKKLAKLFDGVRHDSGDPFIFGEKVIEHYKKLGINPKDKTIVFSDSLNTNLAVHLYETFHKRIKVSFGIGTHFTNDLDVKPLNIVIKIVRAKPADSEEWVDTVKLSDDKGKHTGRYSEVLKAKMELGLLPFQPTLFD